MTSYQQVLSPVYPMDSGLDEHGCLHVGGCSTLELAREFGTPLYVFAQRDLSARARAFRDAFRATHDGESHVVFASKACPAVPVLRTFAHEGTYCDVASGGELALALQAGFANEHIIVHGNAKSYTELQEALHARVGWIVIDNFDDIRRLEQLTAELDFSQRVLVRVTPGVRGATHDAISTGQADSKFGLGLRDAHQAIERIHQLPGLTFDGVHMHIGSQLMELHPFRSAVEAVAELAPMQTINLGGGLGAAYTSECQPPPIEEYAAAKAHAVRDVFGKGLRLLDEPGRALVANAGVTLYTVQTVKRNVSTWVAVDGGMSDNLRPMLYDARYEAQVVNRFDGETPCHLAGKHCESGDVIISDARLDTPVPGDVVVTPATGAYGHSMANTYNGVTRPAMVFCQDGNARLVIRRETYSDLFARDVE